MSIWVGSSSSAMSPARSAKRSRYARRRRPDGQSLRLMRHAADRQQADGVGRAGLLAAAGKFETKCSAYSAAIRATRWLASEQFCLELRGCCSYRKKAQGIPPAQVSRGQEPCPTGGQDAQVLHGRIITILTKRVFPRDRGKVVQSFRHNWFRRMVEKATVVQPFLGVNARGFGVRQGTSSRSTHPHGLSAQPAACVRLILTSAGKDEVASSRAGTHNIRS